MATRTRERTHAADRKLSAELTTARDAAIQAVDALALFWAECHLSITSKSKPILFHGALPRLRDAADRLDAAIKSPAVNGALSHPDVIEIMSVSRRNYAQALRRLCEITLDPLSLKDVDAVLGQWRELKKHYTADAEDMVLATEKLRMQIETEFERALNTITPPADSNGRSGEFVDHPDGPTSPNWFWWHGKQREFQPIPHRLLSCLWDSVDYTASIEDVMDRVWGTDTTDSNLRGTISRLNTALAEHGFPITAAQKSGHVSLTVGNS